MDKKNIPVDWELFKTIIKIGDCAASRDLFETYSRLQFRYGASAQLKEIIEERKHEGH